jgi:hypothetical protein
MGVAETLRRSVTAFAAIQGLDPLQIRHDSRGTFPFRR